MEKLIGDAVIAVFGTKPLLIGTFERSAKQRSFQLVTVVGEPGVGKSRLCGSFSTTSTSDRAGLVRWRQGRCLPYGDGRIRNDSAASA